MNLMSKRICLPLFVAGGLLSTAPTAWSADIFKPNAIQVLGEIPVPAIIWLGPYAGFSIGGAGLGAEIERGTGAGTLEITGDSVSAGAIAGFNLWSFGGAGRGMWLGGVEADIAPLSGGVKKTDATLGQVNLDADWLVSARLRFGRAWDWLYLYGTAGPAFSDIAITQGKARSGGDIRAGVALGFGAEFALNEKWKARGEVISYEFGEESYTLSGSKRDIQLGAATARFAFTRKF